jgi:uncharacterized protein (DUF1501 family)
MSHRTPNQPTRRDFLRVGFGGAGIVSLCGSVPGFVSRMAFAKEAGAVACGDVASDNVLVVVQFSGGNDGLNTVIPFTDPEYVKARPIIAIKDRLLKLNDQLALNPGLQGFKELFDDGQLAVINGCGYPHPNRSHFRSMDIWHTADPTLSKTSGWLGHYLDHQLRGSVNPLKALNVGQQLPLALVAESGPVPSIQTIEDFRIRAENKAAEETIRRINADHAASPALQFLSRQATNAIVSADQVRKVSTNYKADAAYPVNGLGPQLKLIAQIINGGFGTKVFYCQIGGFDTHANQVNQHERLLAETSTAIREFHRDLKAKGFEKKVTVMCFSEFGRRVAQNHSGGTDHGAAGPMFISGGAVKGGIYGTYPTLTDLDDGDLKFTTDFRRSYATILQRWLGADPAGVLGEEFEPLKLL